MTATLSIRVAQAADKELWDAYVKQHPSATPYHRFAWMQAVEEAYGHAAHPLMAMDGEHLVGVLPFVKFSIPLRPSRLCSLPFCDLGGPLTDCVDVEQALLKEARAAASLNQCSAVDLRVEAPEQVVDESDKVRMLLDLPDSAEALLAGFKSKLRSQIRKAEKNGLTGHHNQSPDCLDEFYPVFSRNMRDLGSPTHAKEWFSALKKYYGDDLGVFTVRLDTSVVGAAIVLFNGDKASIPWASTVADFNHLSPNMLLYWTLLAQVCDRACKQFDFGRSTPGEGTHRFKQQWGARPLPLSWYQLDEEKGDLGNATNNKHLARQTLAAIWKKLPLPLANAMGARVRGFISL